MAKEKLVLSVGRIINDRLFMQQSRHVVSCSMCGAESWKKKTEGMCDRGLCQLTSAGDKEMEEEGNAIQFCMRVCVCVT